MAEAKALPPGRGEYRVITCIMPAGRGAEVVEALRRELGVVSTSLHHARGIGTHSLRHRVYSDEKQVLSRPCKTSETQTGRGNSLNL